MAILRAIADEVNKAGRSFIVDIKQDLKASGKSASGSLIRGTTGSTSIIGSRVRFEGKAPEHYVFVDKGRRPGLTPPPIKPILKWVKQKGIGSGKKARGIAFAISKSIGKKGITATNIYTNAIKQFTEGLNIAGIITEEITKEVKQAIK